MDWTGTILDVIDFRSFTSLWYWIVLAVVWSSASHWVLGVPFDMITRARRHGGEAMQDLEELVRINVSRILTIMAVSGTALIAFSAFLHSTLLILAIWYGVEFAQAVSLLAVPLSFVGALSVQASREIAATAPQGEALLRRLMRHRFWTQLIGMVAIFVSAMFGMYQNLATLRSW